MTKQVLVTFSIGNYHDEVLCDVVPMQACHILLGRPWEYDRKVTHDGYKNHYSFVFKEKSVILTSLKAYEASEDQMRIVKDFRERGKHKSDQERSESVKKSDKHTLVSNERK